LAAALAGVEVEALRGSCLGDAERGGLGVDLTGVVFDRLLEVVLVRSGDPTNTGIIDVRDLGLATFVDDAGDTETGAGAVSSGSGAGIFLGDSDNGANSGSGAVYQRVRDVHQ
jgi:hypothetical protein